MKWWGKYGTTPDRWSHWRIGPLSLFAQPRAGEWRIALRHYPDAQDSSLGVDLETDAEPDPESHEFYRYAVGGGDAELELHPRLGDRPFIVSPEQPLFLLSGEKSVLYVSTVVWVQLKVARLEGDAMIDVPTIRRSDTWFGENTREGELCYATKTSARTRLESIEPRPHRAITPIEIRNLGSGVLPIERLRVPVPALSLYADDDNQLWTDAVCFLRQEGEHEAEMTTPDPGLQSAGRRERIDEPRVPVATGTIVKAFSKLLS